MTNVQQADLDRELADTELEGVVAGKDGFYVGPGGGWGGGGWGGWGGGYGGYRGFGYRGFGGRGFGGPGWGRWW